MKRAVTCAAILLAGVVFAVSDAEKNASTQMNATAVERTTANAGGVRVVFIGNSITLHGAAPQIGWTNVWGMAASAEEKDYVHLVTRGIEEKTGRKADVKVRNLAAFERGFASYDYKRDADLVAFKPDYLVFALGENVPDLKTDAEREAYSAAFGKLLGEFMVGDSKPVTVVRGVFWRNVWKDAMMAKAAAEYSVPFVKTDVGDDPSMKALGLFKHQGVANHPGDKGMAETANRILAAMFPKSLKVLMIGNSFSKSNERFMPQVAKSMGLDLELGSLYIGGCSLERHWSNTVAAATNPDFAPYGYMVFKDGKKVSSTNANIPQTLASKKWDVVTIQQASHYSWQPATYHPFGDELVKTIRRLAPQAEIVVQETWSYTPWDGRLAKWKIDQNEMYDHLRRAYRDFAIVNHFRVIPTGTAVQMWRKRLPVKYAENSFGGDVCGYEGPNNFVQDKNGKWIPNPGEKIPGKPEWARKNRCDVFHLNLRGDYFQSLIWTAKLFGADVRKCAFKPDFVSDSDAELMKAIAVEVK